MKNNKDKVDIYFVCSCGQRSTSLERYFKIPKNQVWKCSDCKKMDNLQIISDNVASGAIVAREDF